MSMDQKIPHPSITVLSVYGPVNWNSFSDENWGEDIQRGVGVVKQQKDI
jgi:hypothetical protein